VVGISESGFLESGAAVRVIAVRGTEVVVRVAKASESEGAGNPG
jgi:hypothetical protein